MLPHSENFESMLFLGNFRQAVRYSDGSVLTEFQFFGFENFEKMLFHGNFRLAFISYSDGFWFFFHFFPQFWTIFADFFIVDHTKGAEKLGKIGKNGSKLGKNEKELNFL